MITARSKRMPGDLNSIAVKNPRRRADEFIAAPVFHYRVKASFGPVRQAGPVRPLIRLLPGRIPIWPLDQRPLQLVDFRAEPFVHSSQFVTYEASSLLAIRTLAAAV